MLKTILYSVGPVILVLLAEHVILKYIYGKTSSLERLIVARSDSAKSDWVTAGFYYVLFQSPLVTRIASLLTLPGLAYFGMVWLRPHFQWSGVFGFSTSDNFAVSFAIWFVLSDFSNYAAHFMLHKVPWLWRFHKLHHAPTEFNIITGIRISLAETFFIRLLSFVVLVQLLGVPSPGVFYFVIFTKRVIDLIQHSDLPWDYGALGYVLVSPRYHRIHHSNLRQDYDSNYGDVLSFFDYLFGTVSTRYKDSPATADECSLGLGTEHETDEFNCWKTALVHETLLQYAWASMRKHSSFSKLRSIANQGKS